MITVTFPKWFGWLLVAFAATSVVDSLTGLALEIAQAI